MGETYNRHYLGSATLDETRGNCIHEQGMENSQLRKLEAIEKEDPPGTIEKLNEATFERMEMALDILDDLLFFDVSTVVGTNAANAANQTHKPISEAGSEFQIWVQENLTPIQVLGKTT